MAACREIDPRFWNDRKVQEDMTQLERYIFLYLLTNQHSNICGCYEISARQIAWDTGVTEDKVNKALDNLESTHAVIMRDAETREILIVNWHKYHWSSSEKLLKGVAKLVADIKSETLRKHIEDTLTIRYGYALDTLYIPYPYPIDTVSIPYDSGSDTLSIPYDSSENSVSESSFADDEAVETDDDSEAPNIKLNNNKIINSNISSYTAESKYKANNNPPKKVYTREEESIEIGGYGGKEEREREPKKPKSPANAATKQQAAEHLANFSKFWEAYPKKKNRKDALNAFRKVKAPLEKLLTALERQKRSREWNKENGAFIPYPATWLNGEQWENIITDAELIDTVGDSKARDAPKEPERTVNIDDLVEYPPGSGQYRPRWEVPPD